MAAFQALEQIVLTIEGQEYLCTAMPATQGLAFLEKHQEALDKGKPDLAMMKQIICNHVSKDNMQITEQVFNISFSRKYGHLQKLYQEVLQFNFAEVFQAPDSEE